MTATSHHLRAAFLVSASLLSLPAQAFAQSTDPVAAPPPDARPAGEKRIYSPADFARFAPKTAYDMLVQVPGFSIRGADRERGLGQASENVLINGQRLAKVLLQVITQERITLADLLERESEWYLQHSTNLHPSRILGDAFSFTSTTAATLSDITQHA